MRGKIERCINNAVGGHKFSVINLCFWEMHLPEKKRHPRGGRHLTFRAECPEEDPAGLRDVSTLWVLGLNTCAPKCVDAGDRVAHSRVGAL